jgi:hypothetical protein
MEAGLDGAGGSGNAGGASPTDGSGGCAGIVSFGDANVERAVVAALEGRPVLASNIANLRALVIKFTPTEPLTSIKGLECFTGLDRLDIMGPDLPSLGLLDLSPLAPLRNLGWFDLYFDPDFGRDFGPWPHVLDLSPLAKLISLNLARFDVNAVQDITALGSLTMSSLVLYSDTLSDLRRSPRRRPCRT